MKRLIQTAAFLAVSVVALQAQTGISDDLWIKMKTDSVLNRIYFDISEQVSASIDLTNRVNEAVAPINAEQTVKLQALADSLGVKYNVATKSWESQSDPAAVAVYNHMSADIYHMYSRLSGEATSEIYKEYNTLVSEAFLNAANKYIENSGIMQSKQ